MASEDLCDLLFSQLHLPNNIQKKSNNIVIVKQH